MLGRAKVSAGHGVGLDLLGVDALGGRREEVGECCHVSVDGGIIKVILSDDFYHLFLIILCSICGCILTCFAG